MKAPKPRREIFLLAAESLDADRTGDCYACIVVKQAHSNLINGSYVQSYDCPEMEMLRDLFMPEGLCDSMPWWPQLGEWPDHTHDYESRVLALLLCAEMCEEIKPHQSILERFWNFLGWLSDCCMKSKRVV